MNNMQESDFYKAQDVLPRMEISIGRIIEWEWDARSRLHQAMSSIIPLRYQDFPETQGIIFNKIMLDIGKLDWFQLNDIDRYMIKEEWIYAVYFRKIKNKTAVKYIKMLYSIYKELHIIISKKY